VHQAQPVHHQQPLQLQQHLQQQQQQHQLLQQPQQQQKQPPKQPPKPAQQMAEPPPLAPGYEATLVDVDPAEGKRRGSELLQMLLEKPQNAPADIAPPVTQSTSLGQGRWPTAARRGLAANSATMPGVGGAPVMGAAVASAATGLTEWTPGVLSNAAMTSMAFGGPAATVPVTTATNTTNDGCISQAEKEQGINDAVCEAARRAFGPGAAEVSQTANGGYAVWLYRHSGYSADDAQSQQVALEALGRSLWPMLQSQGAYMEWRSTPSAADEGASDHLMHSGLLGLHSAGGATGGGGLASSGLHSMPSLGGTAGAGGPSRLTIWCLVEEGEYAEQLCWDFVRRGACPRGSRCQWMHAPPPTYPIDVEVFS